MIIKFGDFINDNNNINSVLDESIEPVIRDLEVDDEFDNELTDREAWELDNVSVGKRFTDKELMELNLYFGIYKPKSESYNTYVFKKKYGTFGTPITKLNGEIQKKSLFDDKENTYYLISVHIHISVGPTKGIRHYYLKFDTLKEVFDFFESFER